jgi:hypothetical protein
VIALVLPPALSTLVHTGRAPDLSPRHLIFALPFWAVFIGVAVARAPWRLLALVAVAVLAGISPQGIHDPRSITYTAKLGTAEALAPPSAWLRGRIQRSDVLYPYSSVFLAALPEAGEATALPRGQTGPLLDALERVDYPVPRIFIAVPVGTTGVRSPSLQDSATARFPSWLIVEVHGEFADAAVVLATTEHALRAVRGELEPPVPDALAGWFELNSDVLCKSLTRLGRRCGR